MKAAAAVLSAISGFTIVVSMVVSVLLSTGTVFEDVIGANAKFRFMRFIRESAISHVFHLQYMNMIGWCGGVAFATEIPAQVQPRSLFIYDSSSFAYDNTQVHPPYFLSLCTFIIQKCIMVQKCTNRDVPAAVGGVGLHAGVRVDEPRDSVVT